MPPMNARTAQHRRGIIRIAVWAGLFNAHAAHTRDERELGIERMYDTDRMRGLYTRRGMRYEYRCLSHILSYIGDFPFSWSVHTAMTGAFLSRIAATLYARTTADHRAGHNDNGAPLLRIGESPRVLLDADLWRVFVDDDQRAMDCIFTDAFYDWVAKHRPAHLTPLRITLTQISTEVTETIASHDTAMVKNRVRRPLSRSYAVDAKNRWAQLLRDDRQPSTTIVRGT